MTMLAKTCEDYELDLSALLDGELPPGEVAEAVEHALGCASCAAFFRAARRLGEGAAALAEEPRKLAEPAAERLWERIRDDAARGPASVTPIAEHRSRRTPGRLGGWLRAAALVAAGLGGGFALGSLDAAAELTAAGAPGGAVVATSHADVAMDERRFVALADELMRADVRYQRAMLQVLRLVPAIETGEGLDRDEDSPTVVTAAAREERPRNGLL